MAKVKIKVFPSKVSPEQAWESIVQQAHKKKTALSLEFMRMEVLYYPYLHFCFSLDLSRFRGRKQIKVFCCISLVDGKEAIIKEIPSWEWVEAASEQVLPVKVSSEQALIKARTYILYPLFKKEKVFSPPLPVLELQELCYRPLYLFTARSSSSARFGLLVDALTNRYQTLDFAGCH